MPTSATRTPQLTFDDGSVIGFKDCQACFQQFPLGYYDDVEALRDLVPAKYFPNQPLSTISLDRPADLAGRRDAQPAADRAVGEEEDRAVSTVDLGAALVDPLEFGAMADPLSRAKTHERFFSATGAIRS